MDLERVRQWIEEYRVVVEELGDREGYRECYGVYPEQDEASLVSTPWGQLTLGRLCRIWLGQETPKPDRHEEPRRGTQIFPTGPGGYREGAGRPRRATGLSDVRKTLRLTQEEYDQTLVLLEEGESWSEMVRRIIVQKAVVHQALKKRRETTK